MKIITKYINTSLVVMTMSLASVCMASEYTQSNPQKNFLPHLGIPYKNIYSLLSGMPFVGPVDYDTYSNATKKLCEDNEVVYYRIINNTGVRVAVEQQPFTFGTAVRASYPSQDGAVYQFLRNKSPSEANFSMKLKVGLDYEKEHSIPVESTYVINDTYYKEKYLDITIKTKNQTEKLSFNTHEWAWDTKKETFDGSWKPFNYEPLKELYDAYVGYDGGMIHSVGSKIYNFDLPKFLRKWVPEWITPPMGLTTTHSFGVSVVLVDIIVNYREDPLSKDEEREKSNLKNYQAAYVDTNYYLAEEGKIKAQLGLKERVENPHPDVIPSTLEGRTVEFAGDLTEFVLSNLIVNVNGEKLPLVCNYDVQKKNMKCEFTYKNEVYALETNFEAVDFKNRAYTYEFNLQQHAQVLKIKHIAKKRHHSNEQTTSETNKTPKQTIAVNTTAGFVSKETYDFNSLEFKITRHEGNTRSDCFHDNGNALYAGQLDTKFKFKVIVNGTAIDADNLVLPSSKGAVVDFKFNGKVYHMDIEADTQPIADQLALGSCSFTSDNGKKTVTFKIRKVRLKKIQKKDI